MPFRSTYIITSGSRCIAPGGSLQDGSWDELQAPPMKKPVLKPCLIFIIPPLPHPVKISPHSQLTPLLASKVYGKKYSDPHSWGATTSFSYLFTYYQNWAKEKQEVPKWITWVPTILFTTHVRAALPPLGNQNHLPVGDSLLDMLLLWGEKLSDWDSCQSLNFNGIVTVFPGGNFLPLVTKTQSCL